MNKGTAQNWPPLAVKVWGDLACFTRPEMKAERVSYPLITPSAARGVLEAVFWKPQFSWRIREIHVLKPIRYFSLLRNEVTSKALAAAAKSRFENGDGYFVEEDRAQRHTLALRDVAYMIYADVCPRPYNADAEARYRDQFRRNVARGRCHHMPYLGCREFTAFFGEPEGSDKAIDHDEDLGHMLFDIDYDKFGRGRPKFFAAKLEDGVLRVPAELYGETEVTPPNLPLSQGEELGGDPLSQREENHPALETRAGEAMPQEEADNPPLKIRGGGGGSYEILAQ